MTTRRGTEEEEEKEKKKKEKKKKESTVKKGAERVHVSAEKALIDGSPDRESAPATCYAVSERHNSDFREEPCFTA